MIPFNFWKLERGGCCFVLVVVKVKLLVFCEKNCFARNLLTDFCVDMFHKMQYNIVDRIICIDDVLF